MSVDQKITRNTVEIAKEFLHDINSIGEFTNLSNMDGTPCYFVIRGSSTVDKKGVQIVKIKTTSAEHLCFTVALTAGVKKQKMCFLLFASLLY